QSGSQGRIHAGTEGDFPHGASLIGFVVRELDALQAGAAQPVAMVHFSEVVVFARQPEYRHGLNALRGELLREANGGEGLIERVGWAGEKPGLLAGHNGDGARGQKIEMASHAGIPAQTLIDGAESGDEFGSLRAGAFCEGGGGAHAFEGGWMLEIRADLAE